MATHQVRHSTSTHYHAKRPLPVHPRPAKPVSLSKRPASHSTAKKAAAAAAAAKEDRAEEEQAMAASFLQFCATCEKQIIVPSNSLLYCSESCRQQDSQKQCTPPLDLSPPTTPFANFTFEDLQFRDIVPARHPTQIQSKRSSCVSSDLESDDNTILGDDPYAKSSEASRYLRQFRSGAYSVDTAATMRPRRPAYVRASTSQVSSSAAPSLSHTPASSLSYSLPYTPLQTAPTRPLPSRTNPYSSSYGSRSLDLVTPWFQPDLMPLTEPSTSSSYSMKGAPSSGTSVVSPEGEILYAKSPIPSLSPANGSLGRLLQVST